MSRPFRPLLLLALTACAEDPQAPPPPFEAVDVQHAILDRVPANQVALAIDDGALWAAAAATHHGSRAVQLDRDGTLLAAHPPPNPNLAQGYTRGLALAAADGRALIGPTLDPEGFALLEPDGTALRHTPATAPVAGALPVGALDGQWVVRYGCAYDLLDAQATKVVDPGFAQALDCDLPPRVVDGSLWAIADQADTVRIYRDGEPVYQVEAPRYAAEQAPADGGVAAWWITPDDPDFPLTVVRWDGQRTHVRGLASDRVLALWALEDGGGWLVESDFEVDAHLHRFLSTGDIVASWVLESTGHLNTAALQPLGHGRVAVAWTTTGPGSEDADAFVRVLDEDAD